jgi:hypothetical protein
MKISDPSAPDDSGIFQILTPDGGSLELRMVDDLRSGYTCQSIERQGTKVTRIISNGKIIFGGGL